MGRQPYFSILIPVFNQIGKMDHCVECLKKQTFPDFEVIWVDDASTDGSGEFLETLAAADARFRVLHHEKNGSVCAARYTAMAAAKGKYVLFIDSDDYIELRACELLHERLERQHADLLSFGAVMEPSGGKLSPELPENPLKSCLEGTVYQNLWKYCYSGELIRKTVEKTEPFCCNMGEDNFYSAMFFLNAESTGVLDEVLYHYIVGQGMSTRRNDLSVEKLWKDVAAVEASGDHLLEAIGRDAPEYISLAGKTARRMLKFVLFQHIYFEEDWCRVFEYMQEFRNEKYRDIFEFGCNTILPNKIRKSLGISVGRFSFD